MKTLNALLINLLVVVSLLVTLSCSEKENGLLGGVDFDAPNALKTDTVSPAPQVDTALPRKYIYLTIDDAPLTGSEYIDSVIAAEKVKISLFVVGSAVNGSGRFKKYYKQLQKNSFVEIYNHSYSHANNRYAKYYKSSESVLEDFSKNESELSISHKIARLPGRNLWWVGEKKKNCKQTGTTSAELLVEKGYKVFGWDVEWKYDSKDYTPQQSIDELVEEVVQAYEGKQCFSTNHVVLLLHNQMFTTVGEANNLAELVTKLKDSGFTFEYLSAYPETLSKVKGSEEQAITLASADTITPLWYAGFLLNENFIPNLQLETISLNERLYACW